MKHSDIKSSNQLLVFAEEIEEVVSSRSTPLKRAIAVIENGFGGAADLSRTQTTEYFACELAGDENEMVHE
jgi:hypothetical protein